MANPIKTSDLYKDTGELDKLLADLKAVESQYESLLKKVNQDAIKLQASIQGLNVAQEAHREQLKESATQADKLEKAQAKYKTSLSDTQTQILAVQAATRDANRIKKLEIKLANSAEGSYNKLSAQYSLNKIALNQMSQAQRENTDEGRKLVEQSREIYEEMKRLQEETGKHTLNVGNYKNAIKDAVGELGGLPPALNGAVGAVGKLSAAFRLLLANPIVAVIAALVGLIGALFQAFLRSEKGAQLLAKATGFIQGIMSTLTGIASALYDRLVGLFEDPIGSIKNFGRALVENVTNRLKGLVEVIKAVGAGFKALWQRDMEALKQAGQDAAEALKQAATGFDAEQQKAIADAFRETTAAIQENTNAFIKLEEAKRQVARSNIAIARGIETLRTEEQRLLQIQEDDTLGFEKRQAAAEKAREATIALSREEIKLAQNNLSLLNQEISIRQRNGENVLALQEQQLSAYQALAAAERDLTLNLADGEEKRRRLRQDEAERDLDILIDGYDNQKTINERIINDAQRTFEERRSLLNQTVQLGEDSFARQVATLQLFTQESINANDLVAESDAVVLNAKIRALGLSEILEGRLLEVVRDRRTAILDLAEAEKALNQAEAQAAEARRAELLRRAKEEQALEMKQFDQQQALAKAEFEVIERTEAEKTRFRLEAERERFEKIIELNEAFQGDLSKTEIDTFKALIQGINNELDSLKDQTGDRDLLGLLGINLGDDQRETLKSSFAFAKEQLAEWAAFRVQKAGEAVEAANGEVESAQERLRLEIEARNQGLASKVDTAEKELAAAKKNQAAALSEQRKAQRAEQRIQTAQQAVNLITASTKIWSQFGFPGALIPLSFLWGSFIASKVRANQLTKKENRLGSFEYLGQAGNRAGAEDIFLGITPDGRARTASKGESLAVFNTEATRKYSALPEIVDSLNRGNFENLFGRVADAGDDPGLIMFPGLDTGTMENELSRIRRNGETQTFVDAKGRTVVIKGNKKTIYLN